MTKKQKGAKPPTLEDLNLWKAYTQGIKSLGDSKKIESPSVPEPKKVITSRDSSRNQLVPTGSSGLPSLKYKGLRRLKRPEVDARLDLHGLRKEEAYQALQSFIQKSFAQKNRCLLVITGKGGRENTGRGILRESLPEWLENSEMRPYIGGYAQAHLYDGGQGAFYIFLKKNILQNF